jgi:hypothetical protein
VDSDLTCVEAQPTQASLEMTTMKQFVGATIGNPRFDVARSPAAAESAATIPLVLTLIVIGLFLPEELSFYMFGLRLTVIRLICLFVAPVLLAKGIQKISSGNYRFVLSDLFVISAGFWLIYAPANVDDSMSALNHAGPLVLEFCVAYLTTRILLSEHGQALSFAAMLCRAIAIVALVGVLDPLTNHRFAHDLVAQLTAPMHNIDDWTDAYRLGLLRATGPIEHPILFAFISTIGLLVALSIPVRGRPFVIVSCALGTVLGLSSAPIQTMLFGLCLLAYNHLLSKSSYRWSVLIIAGAAGIIAAFLISNNPVGFIIANLTFTAESGYYREWTWHMVGLYVSQSPWFGLGYGELPDEINHSIDSLWLVLTILSGYPGAVLVALSLVGAGPILTRGRNADLTPAESKLGTTLGIVLFLALYLGITVHMWGSTWILIGLVIGMKAHLSELGYLHRGVPPSRLW